MICGCSKQAFTSWLKPHPVDFRDRIEVVAMDGFTRRVQQDQLGHRGRRNDPLYQVHNVLRAGVEKVFERQIIRLDAGLGTGDPNSQVTVAWQCYQKLRAAFTAKDLQRGRRIAIEVLDSFHT